MDKMRIQEIIVVEGKDDTRRLREVVDADTIETIGSAINEDILMQIEHAQETRGVIVFTENDYLWKQMPLIWHQFLLEESEMNQAILVIQ